MGFPGRSNDAIDSTLHQLIMTCEYRVQVECIIYNDDASEQHSTNSNHRHMAKCSMHSR